MSPVSTTAVQGKNGIRVVRFQGTTPALTTQPQKQKVEGRGDVKASKITKPKQPMKVAEPIGEGWTAFDPTSGGDLQEVLIRLGGELTISATTFNGKIMAALRRNKVEYEEDEHGVSQEQFIPQKGQGVYLNVEGSSYRNCVRKKK